MKNILIFSSVILFVFFSGCKKDSPTEPQPTKPPGYQEDIPWPSLADSPWPMYQHDPQFTGRSSFEGPLRGSVEWMTAVSGGEDQSFLLAANNEIYLAYGAVNPESTLTSGAYLFKYKSNGSLNWVKQLNLNNFSSEVTCSPLLNSVGNIVSTSGSGMIIIFDSLSNKTFEKNIGEQIYSGYGGLNLDKEGNIYVGAETGLKVLDKNGIAKWTNPSYLRQNVVFSADGKKIFVKKNGSLDALDLSGNIIWSYPIAPGEYAVFHKVVDAYSNLYFFDANALNCLMSNGSFKWKFFPDSLEKIQLDVAPTINKNGDICFLTDKFLYSINYEGKMNWKYSSTNFNGSHLVNDLPGNVYLSEYSGGKILSVSREGKLNWKLSIGDDFIFNTAGVITKDKRLLLVAYKNNTSYLISIN